MNVVSLEAGMVRDLLGLSAWHAVPVETTPFNSYSEQKAEIERLHAQVRTALGRSESGLLTDVVFTLRDPLRVAVLLGRAPSDAYGIICWIAESFRVEDGIRLIATIADQEAWNSSIAAARRARALSNFAHHDPERFSRPTAVAGACRRLEGKGYAIEISSFGPHFTEASYASICNEIDSLVRRVGGKSVVDRVLAWLKANNRIYHGSLLHGRRTDNMMANARLPSLPLHYLYNLAWKHWGAAPTSVYPDEDYGEICNLARDMAAVLDVEAYSLYDGMSLSLPNLHGSLSDKTVYDELFAFQQWQPTIAPRLFAAWLQHLHDQGCVFPIATFEEWAAFGAFLIAQAKIDGLAFVTASDIAPALMSPQQAKALFVAVSLPMGSVNRDFLTPQDTSLRNAPYFPAYRADDGLYVLPPRAVIGRALYERLYTLMREANVPQLENMLAAALESLTVDALSMAGERATVIGKKYRLAGKPKGEDVYEVDVASETDERIFLFECKKKPLTNLARGGNALKALVDFAQGFVSPLVQMSRHELQLCSGGISFLEGGALDLGTRVIDHIPVSMTDHGSMQDRTFLRAFILSLWEARFSMTDPDLQAIADKVNAQMSDLKDGVLAISGATKEPWDEFFKQFLHNTWWLSIDQLTYLCSRGKRLKDVLSPLRSIAFGTGDMMAETAAYERMRRSAGSN